MKQKGKTIQTINSKINNCNDKGNQNFFIILKNL